MFGMDAKILDFSINGQETAFMMLFLALTLNALMVHSRHTILKLGLAWAGLMWTRPDGFIYIAAICLGFLLFNAGKKIAESRLGLLKIFIYAGAITGVLYLPWFLWAWYYYGSPIPHTIIAKGHALYAFSPYSFGNLLVDFLTFPLSILVGDKPICTTFLPTYFFFGGWHYTAFIFSRYLTCICALYWCLPFGRSQARAVSFAFMICLFYITNIVSSAPWYVPSCTFLAVFVFAYFIQQSLNLASMLKEKNEKTFRSSIKLVHALTISALAGTLLLTLCSAYQLRIRQREIEDGNRKKIGLWLRQNAASPADTVFLESLGYIGFYSQLKMLDYPGLCAPEVVAAQKKLQTGNWAKLIPELHPDWLVLRGWEAEKIQKINPLLLTQSYFKVMFFDATKRILSYRFLPGRDYLLYDSTFIVFKLNNNKTQEELKKP
jgi:hypothetical protein